MNDEKKIMDELPEPIDIKIDTSPEVKKKKKKKKKSDKKDEPVVAAKKDSLEELIEKNIKWSKAIYTQNKKIKSRLGMMVFLNYLKLFLIIAPIIVALIYLPAFIKQYMAQIENIFGVAPGGASLVEMLTEGYGLDGIIPDIKK